MFTSSMKLQAINTQEPKLHTVAWNVCNVYLIILFRWGVWTAHSTASAKSQRPLGDEIPQRCVTTCTQCNISWAHLFCLENKMILLTVRSTGLEHKTWVYRVFTHCDSICRDHLVMIRLIFHWSGVWMVISSDVHMMLHEALVVSVDPSRWRPWFKEKGSKNVSSVCFQPFVEQRAPSRGLNRYD